MLSNQKKRLILIAVAILIVAAAVLALTNGFTKSAVSGKLYRVDNVYEEIWNLVISEKSRTRTILTTSTDKSEVDYDLGAFQQVNVHISDERYVALSFYNDELNIRIFEKNGDLQSIAHYVYNYKTGTLYGDREEEYLFDKFTSLYYSWMGASGKFSHEIQGDYTFVIDKSPLSHK